MKVNWGILSTAHINRKVIPAIHQSPRSELRAVASRDLNKAQVYAEHWSIPKAYGSYEELIDDCDIDVVYISLPNHLHREWIIRALNAGKHVLCEKPMCLTMDEFESIDLAVKSTGMRVMEGFMHLYHPQTQLWKSIIDSDTIGEIHSMRSCFTFNFDRDPDNYRWKPEYGGGALWDVGVYPVSLFQYLYNEVPVACISSSFEQNGIDYSTSALLSFEGGKAAQFFVSFRSSYSTDTVIHGSTGQLYISHPYSNADLCQAYIRRDDKVEYLDAPRQYLYAGEIEAMNDIVLHQKEPLVKFETSKNVLATVLKLKNDVVRRET